MMMMMATVMISFSTTFFPGTLFKRGRGERPWERGWFFVLLKNQIMTSGKREYFHARFVKILMMRTFRQGK